MDIGRSLSPFAYKSLPLRVRSLLPLNVLNVCHTGEVHTHTHACAGFTVLAFELRPIAAHTHTHKCTHIHTSAHSRSHTHRHRSRIHTREPKTHTDTRQCTHTLTLTPVRASNGVSRENGGRRNRICDRESVRGCAWLCVCCLSVGRACVCV